MGTTTAPPPGALERDRVRTGATDPLPTPPVPSQPRSGPTVTEADPGTARAAGQES